MKLLLALTVLFLTSFPAPLLGEGEVIDRIVASIDGDPVTEDELRDIIAAQLMMSQSEGKQDLSKLDPKVIKEGIITILFDKEAKRLGVRVTPEDLNAYVQQVEQANDAGEGSLIAALEEKGVSFEMYKKKVSSEMIRSRVLSAELRPKIQVSDEEVDEYVGKSSSESSDMVDKDLFTLLQVTFIDVSKGQADNADDQLENMRKAIRETKSCASLSDLGGYCENLGQVKLKDLKEDLQELLKGKSNYQPSDVVTAGTTKAFYLMAPQSYSKETSQVREDVRQRLFQERFMAAAEKYLKEELFNRYHVEIH